MRSVLVTGASTGIGHAVVTQAVAAGFGVWATVRRDEDAAVLTAAHGARVRPLVMDVTDGASIEAAAARVAASGPLFGLVNNAGVALPGPLEHLPLDLLRRQLEVNLVGQLAVTQALLPALRRGRETYGDARIVMMGSIGGRVAGPMLGPYHVSKFGLAGLSGALRAELAPSGIQVLLVEPGAIATPIWGRGIEAGSALRDRLPAEAEERYGRQLARAMRNARRAAEKGLPPEKAAAVVVQALTERHPAPRRLVGVDARFAAAMARLLPERALARVFAAQD